MKIAWSPLGPIPKSKTHDIKWVRTEVINFDDIKKSWLVKKTKSTPKNLPVYTSGKFKNCIGAAGLVLVKIPKPKWVISGYYMDKKDNAWTLLIAADGSGKTKKIKGVA